MPAPDYPCCSAFQQHRLIVSGALPEVVRAAKLALDAGVSEPLLIFDDASSRQIEVDFRGTLDAVLARLPTEQQQVTNNRGPGRPKLGVVAREVTLLPRHWDWLGQQPGGASAVLRKLVEQAARSGIPKQHARLATEAVDRFMHAMTGNFREHEEASRAFYRGEQERFARLIARWPVDVRDHLSRLAKTAWDAHTDGT